MKIQSLKIPAALIGLGLLLGLAELAFLVTGDRMLRHCGNIGRLFAMLLYAAGIPFAFAFMGGLAWRKHPLLAGVTVCMVVVAGLAAGAVLAYIAVGQPGSQFYPLNPPPNYYTLGYAIGEFLRILPFGLVALAWAVLIGSAGGGMAWARNKKRQSAEPATAPYSEPAARPPQG